MNDYEKMKKVMNKIGEDYKENFNIIKSKFELDYVTPEKQNLLHLCVDQEFDEVESYNTICTLLKAGLNPNEKNILGENFIQTALSCGFYDEKFICNIITQALEYGLNINDINSIGENIMHTAINSVNYTSGVNDIYRLLGENGLNSNIKNKKNQTILDAMYEQDKYSDEEIIKFSELFDYYSECQIINEKIQKEKYRNNKGETKKSKLTKFGQILTDKKYKTFPTIGREEELKNLMIILAQEKKSPIVVGESGVGKTAIVEELAYRIQKGNVPSFLKDKIILEVNPNDLIAGKKYTGEFEQVIKNLSKVCNDERIILFIDEIHTMYGVGSHDKSDVDMAVMLKEHIDRDNIKIIGTTTNIEYEKYFSKDALKRRFERVIIKEPSKEILFQILDKVINDYIYNTNINFKDGKVKNEIIKIIIEATSNNHRVYNDKLNNPDLSISIIDRAFATAKVFEDELITPNNFIESFKYCSKIYESRKEIAIGKLEQINTKLKREPSKIIKIDFRRKK